MSKALQTVLLVVVVLVLVGGSFYGGTLYGKQQAESSLPEVIAVRMAEAIEEGGMPFEPGQGLRQGMTDRIEGQAGQGPGGNIGQIEEINGDTIIISGFDGGQTEVKVTDTTLIEKYASVTAADLAVGETVIVSGSRNDDGTITARSVQVAQMGRFAGAGTRGAPDGK